MSRIDCFTKHAPELEKEFKKMVDEGVPEMEAAKKLVDERAVSVSKELNDFKKSKFEDIKTFHLEQEESRQKLLLTLELVFSYFW